MIGATNSFGYNIFQGGRIIVKYPLGYTCTLTNNNIILTTPPNTTEYLFAVVPGTWTILCTDGVTVQEDSCEIIQDSYSTSIFDFNE